MKATEKLIVRVENALKADRARSAWNKGVNAYAMDILESLAESASGDYIGLDDLTSPKLLERAMLDGADSWHEYSWGGMSLIYNGDIVERLCNATELKRSNNGTRKPNGREEWLDTQARALYQAARKLHGLFNACAILEHYNK